MLTTEIGSTDRLVLDTHVWVWLLEGASDKLAPSLIPEIERAARDGRAAISAISIWEVAMLEQRGRLALSADLRTWVQASIAAPGLRILPLAPEVLIESTTLPDWTNGKGAPHKDPADRWIAATARRENAILLSADAEVLRYAKRGHVRAYDVKPRSA